METGAQKRLSIVTNVYRYQLASTSFVRLPQEVHKDPMMYLQIFLDTRIRGRNWASFPGCLEKNHGQLCQGCKRNFNGIPNWKTIMGQPVLRQKKNGKTSSEIAGEILTQERKQSVFDQMSRCNPKAQSSKSESRSAKERVCPVGSQFHCF